MNFNCAKNLVDIFTNKKVIEKNGQNLSGVQHLFCDTFKNHDFLRTQQNFNSLHALTIFVL